MGRFHDLLKAAIYRRFHTLDAAADAAKLKRPNLSSTLTGARPISGDTLVKWLFIWGIEGEEAEGIRDEFRRESAPTLSRLHAAEMDELQEEIDQLKEALVEEARKATAHRDTAIAMRGEIRAAKRAAMTAREEAKSLARRLATAMAYIDEQDAALANRDQAIAILLGKLREIEPATAAEIERKHPIRTPMP
jgi:hypothetical protein